MLFRAVEFKPDDWISPSAANEKIEEYCKDILKKYQKWKKIPSNKKEYKEQKSHEWYGLSISDHKQRILKPFDWSNFQWLQHKQNKNDKLGRSKYGDKSTNAKWTQSNIEKASEIGTAQSNLAETQKKESKIYSQLYETFPSNKRDECVKMVQDFSQMTHMRLLREPYVPSCTFSIKSVPNTRLGIDVRTVLVCFGYYTKIEVKLAPSEITKSNCSGIVTYPSNFGDFIGLPDVTKDEIIWRHVESVIKRCHTLHGTGFIHGLLHHLTNEEDTPHWLLLAIFQLRGEDGLSTFMEHHIYPWNDDTDDLQFRDLDALDDLAMTHSEDGLRAVKLVQYLAKRVMLEILIRTDQERRGRVVFQFLSHIVRVFDKTSVAKLHEVVMAHCKAWEYNALIQVTHDASKMNRDCFDFDKYLTQFCNAMKVLKILATFKHDAMLTKDKILKYWNIMLILCLTALVKVSENLEFVVDSLINGIQVMKLDNIVYKGMSYCFC